MIGSHQKLFNYFIAIANFTFEYPTEGLRFLYNMKIYHTLDEILICLGTAYNSAESYLNYLTDIPVTQNSTLESSSESNVCNIICRNEGTKIQQPAGKPLFILKCPKCDYQFVASTDNTLHRSKIQNFEALYKEHFLHTEPETKTIVDQGFIGPIFSLLKTHGFLLLALIFIIIGIIILIISHIYFALFFWAIAFVLIIVDVFNLGDILY